MNKKTKIKILFSGSFRFFDEMKKMKENLEHLGFECILPRFALGNDLSPKEILKIKEERKDLKNDEFEKIIEVKKWYYDQLKKCDVMLVFDINGYVGVSTAVEIGMAHLLEKPVLFLEKPEDHGILALIEISKNFRIANAEKLADEIRLIIQR